MPICAHLTLSNSAIAHIYKPRHIALPDTQPIYRVCRACSATQVCTAVAFIANPLPPPLTSNTETETPTLTLAIEIVRVVGTLLDPSNPHWQSHALPRTEMDGLAAWWTEWLTFCAQLLQERVLGHGLRETRTDKLGNPNPIQFKSCLAKLKVDLKTLLSRRGRGRAAGIDIDANAEKAFAWYEEEDIKTPLLGSDSDAQKQKAEKAALDSSRKERERTGALTWVLPTNGITI